VGEKRQKLGAEEGGEDGGGIGVGREWPRESDGAADAGRGMPCSGCVECVPIEQ